MKRIWIVGGMLALTAGAVWLWQAQEAKASLAYRSAPVERGTLRVTSTATGTVQPVTQVQVGTQVSGTIKTLHADFNSRVKAGQVLAQIDPALFQSRLDQDKANLARALADVERVRAGLVQAERDLERARKLAAGGLVPASDLDAAIASRDSLAAQIRVSEAGVDQARSSLQNSQVNLDYTTILSPIDGIVVSRSVDVGQTVAASLSAPTLFVIAGSLEKIQVQASVSEADIGRIALGQDAGFTVDAFPETRFRGRVSQIRLAPTTVQNVVTYTVLVDAENPDEKLLPGMTASLSFLIANFQDVLKVPNAALRFTPPGAPAEESAGGPHAHGKARPERQDRVWILEAGAPKAVPVQVGASDGSFTVITEGALQAGDKVLTGAQQGPAADGVKNPFAPFSSGHGGPRPRG